MCRRIAPMHLVAAVLAAGPLASARAEILNLTAQIKSSVRELHNGTEIQTDTAMQDYPVPAGTSPVATLTNLDRLNEDSATVAASTSVVVFNDPRVAGIIVPNDFGIDLAGYSLVPESAWVAEANATTRRTIVFTPTDVNALAGQPLEVQSVVLLSGAMLLTGVDASQDMTGAVAAFDFSVTQERPGQAPAVVLTASATLTGGPGGSVTATYGGAMQAVANSHPIINQDGTIPGVGLFRVVFFTAALPADQYRYTYRANVGEPFDLVFTINARLDTPPNGSGGSILLGLPQGSLPDVMARVRQGDAGQRIMDAVAEMVDTSGSDAPAMETQVVRLGLISVLPQMCGALGLESALAAGLASGLAACLGARRGVRRCRR